MPERRPFRILVVASGTRPLAAGDAMAALAAHENAAVDELHVLLAPFFCTGLFHARRRRVIAMWILYGGLVALIISVRKLAQPWRGMIDAGVVVGLSWGVIAILVTYLRAMTGNPPAASPELPGEDERKR